MPKQARARISREKMNKSKIILDLCGGTGSWSKPYLEAGYTMFNITLPEYDVRDVGIEKGKFIWFSIYLVALSMIILI